MDDPMEQILNTRVRIKLVNEMIVCKICRGYFINPTTVTECLHTFCKSCLVRKLEMTNRCPECNEVVHNTRPLDFIQHDRTMQDLVNKIVPNLEENEYKRELKYCKDKGIPCPREQPSRKEEHGTEEKPKEEVKVETNTFSLEEYRRYDQQMNILLECKLDDENSNLKAIAVLKKKFPPKKYLRCSSMATVKNLKKFIVNEFLRSMDEFKDVEILCNNKPISQDHNLKFVYVTSWKTKNVPLHLQYVPKESNVELKRVQDPEIKKRLKADLSFDEPMETNDNEQTVKEESDGFETSDHNNNNKLDKSFEDINTHNAIAT